MTTINIFDLCKRMQAQGFEYGTFREKSAFDILSSGVPSFPPLYLKPQPGIYFSKISQSLDEENPDDDDCVSLEWHNFVMQEEHHIDVYEKRPIVFAKFDTTRLTNKADHRFQAHGIFRDESFIINMPDWNYVSRYYAGVHVDPCSNDARDIFRDWNVETVCVWDLSVITEMHWFEPAGQPWTYKLA